MIAQLRRSVYCLRDENETNNKKKNVYDITYLF